MAWNDQLNGTALDIASNNERVLRVVAGPGTGKTFSLMRRLARILEEGVNPRNILLVTFTRIAAQDLAKGISELQIEGAENIRKGTLHSFCHETLGTNQVLEATGRFPRMLFEFEKKFLLQDLSLHNLGNHDEREERLSAFEAAWARLQTDVPGWPNDPLDQQFNNSLIDWLTYHESMLIGELVPITLGFLRNNPANELMQQYSHVFIDEYQDLNRAEQTLLDLLVGNSNVTVIGDEDQSIYEKMRYAHPEGITQFHETHDNTNDIPIIECRRCPRRVVEISNALIQHNLNRADRVLAPRAENIEGDIDVVQWRTIDEEVQGIADYVARNILNLNFLPQEVLILSPRRLIGYRIRDALTARGIEAHSFFKEELLDANPKLLVGSEAIQAFSLLLLLENPNDRVALRCWLGFGSNSLRAEAYQRVRDLAAANGLSPIVVLERALRNEINVPHGNELLDRFRELTQERARLAILDDQGKFDSLFSEEAVWSSKFRRIVQEKLDAEHRTLSDIINAIRVQATQPELPTDVKYVRIMSLQKSKGLSADHVIVTNCIQGLIPTLTENEPALRQRELEEQRRLFYVAITRTKQTLLLSSSANLPYGLVRNMGARAGRRVGNLVQTIASDFIAELGPAAPQSEAGMGWLNP